MSWGMIGGAAVSLVGNKVLGGDKPQAGGSSASTGEYKSEVLIPDYLKSAIKGDDGLAARASEFANRPYQAYEGERYAPFNQDQLSAFQGVRDLQGQYGGAFDSAMNLNEMAGQRAQEGFVTPESIAQYMNPYQQQVTDINKRETLRDFDGQLNDIGDAALNASAFGGDRHGVVESEARRNLTQQLADMQTQGSHTAYNQALGTALNTGIAETGAMGAAAGQQAGLAGQAQGYGLNDLAALQQTGGQQYSREQGLRDFDYGQFMEEREYPAQQMTQQASILYPLLGQQGVQTGGQQAYNPGLSNANAALGGAALGNSLGGLFGGGRGGGTYNGIAPSAAGFQTAQANNVGSGMFGPGFKEGGAVPEANKYGLGGLVSGVMGMAGGLMGGGAEGGGGGGGAAAAPIPTLESAIDKFTKMGGLNKEPQEDFVNMLLSNNNFGAMAGGGANGVFAKGGAVPEANKYGLGGLVSGVMGMAGGLMGGGAEGGGGGGFGDDTLYGGDDNDIINGGYGNDELYGGAGDDQLWGGDDTDTLRGGNVIGNYLRAEKAKKDAVMEDPNTSTFKKLMGTLSGLELTNLLEGTTRRTGDAVSKFVDVMGDTDAKKQARKAAKAAEAKDRAGIQDQLGKNVESKLFDDIKLFAHDPDKYPDPTISQEDKSYNVTAKKMNAVLEEAGMVNRLPLVEGQLTAAATEEEKAPAKTESQTQTPRNVYNSVPPTSRRAGPVDNSIFANASIPSLAMAANIFQSAGKSPLEALGGGLDTYIGQKQAMAAAEAEASQNEFANLVKMMNARSLQSQNDISERRLAFESEMMPLKHDKLKAEIAGLKAKSMADPVLQQAIQLEEKELEGTPANLRGDDYSFEGNVREKVNALRRLQNEGATSDTAIGANPLGLSR